jgi:predicted aspartyl protease
MNTNSFLKLELAEVEPGEHLPYVSVIFDGKQKKLLLDTGAKKSSIVTDDWSSQYPVIENDQNHFSQGASGVKVKCELIEINKLEIGNVSISDHQIKRCQSDIFGLDLIGDTPFEVDYKKGRLNYLLKIDKSSSHKLGRMKKGHLTVKTKIKDEEYSTILDTGATVTIVDLSYVKKHPSLFKLIKRDDGTDGHSGEEIKSYRYKLSQLFIGDVSLKNISIISFDFPDNMKRGFEGSPIMIGNDILKLATWKFDLKNMLWQMTMYK